MTIDLISQFDACIRRDPARRGLTGGDALYGPLCPGHLAAAARDLATDGRRVAIVTGFYIPGGEPPAAETDGPPGAALLASALSAAGIEAWLITDRFCGSAVTIAAAASDFPAHRVVVVDDATDAWCDAFYTGVIGRELTHLIAIERVGPSHTVESLCGQPRNTPTPVERFCELTPAPHRGRCHNMRGEQIDEFTGGLHHLFERLPGCGRTVTTIGIGDGGNEIGMGAILWEDLARRLAGPCAARIPCRVAADWNIVAGTSNWGAYALAAAVLWLRDQTAHLAPWGQEHQQRVLEQLVADGPAVDGVTCRREPTVDGLPFLTYIQPWVRIRALLGFE